MGIFDFLRKLMENPETTKPETGKVSISNIEEWTENKTKELKTKEKESLDLVHKEIKNLSDELKEKIDAAKDFNVNSKKAEDRIKSAVEEGRKKYLESVDDLLDSLNNLEKESLERAIIDSDKIFSDFNRKSKASYEKGNYLDWKGDG